MSAKRILIADDDLSLLKAIQTRLEHEGFEVIVSQDAYQALELARKNKPDLLLLDINMPAGNGFSVLERVRNIPELGETPVVYITGEKAPEIEETAATLGAVAVIHKPFDTGEMLATIREALGYWIDPERSAGRVIA